MDAATRALLNSVGLIVLSAIFTFVAAMYWFHKNQRIKSDEAKVRTEEKTAERIAVGHKDLLGRVHDLERQLILVSSTVQPISAAFQALLIKELTHFHTPEMDELMTRLGPPSTLNDREEARLAALLKERSNDMANEIPESEREAALILPYVIKRAKLEAETLRDPSVLAVVKVPREADSEN